MTDSVEVEDFAPLLPSHRVEALLHFECRVGAATVPYEIPAPVIAEKDCAMTQDTHLFSLVLIG
eukprot:COSAG05_NODE_362_length_10792_cov_14.566913_6_plen_64_part_00